MYYTYILRCGDGSLYTGMTNDIKGRIRSHYYKKPGCAKYTRSHNVVGVEQVWQTEDKAQACRLEYRIKRLKKSQKQALIDSPESVCKIADGSFTPIKISLSEVTND